MTDKQIIIDGVDIGWCKNYNEANSKDCETLYICAENPNCYYKQLKRKEQECDELAYENYELNELFDRLKAENEELKKNYFTVIQQRNKAEQTLTEIKEIIHFNKTNRLSGGADISIAQILQKISECEGDNENR